MCSYLVHLEEVDCRIFGSKKEEKTLNSCEEPQLGRITKEIMMK